ncbi:LamG-like jellyroll fold domain-containing protein [Patescibacteria group bacterium]
MRDKLIQYVIIAATLTAIGGSVWYFNSIASTKVNSSQETKLTDGLQLHYTFDGNHMDWSQSTAEARDQSGNGNHGDVQNDATSIIGKVGQALYLDGNGDNVQKNSVSNFPTTEITASFWMRSSDITKAGTPMGYSVSGGNDFLLFNYNNFNIYRGGSAIATSVSANDGEWHHISATWRSSDGAVELYKDGNSAFSNYLAQGTSITQNGCFVVGQEQDAVCGGFQASQAFLGDIDEVRIYNRILNSDEISQLYNQGAAKINASQETKLTDGLVGNWTFDGNHMDWGASNEALDQGTGGNDGDVINATGIPGKIGQALNFNGASSRVNIADVPLFSNSGYAMSAWVYPNGIQNGLDPLVWGSTCAGMRISNSSNYIQYALFNATPTFKSCISNSGIPSDEWTLVTVSYDDSADKMVMYFNDGLHKECPSTGGLSATYFDGTCNMSAIGGDGSTRFYNGKIDEVRIYNRTLLVNEVSELYQQGQAKINASQNQKLTDGLILNHTFDGNHMDWSQAAISRDQAGSNHGTFLVSPEAVIGKIGQAIDFNNDNGLNVGDLPAIENQSAFTISGWVNLNSRSAYDTVFAKFGIASMGIDADYSGTDWSGWAGAGAGYAYTTTAIGADEIGEWHLWTVVFDGTQSHADQTTQNNLRLKFYHDTDQYPLSFSTPGMYVDVPASSGENSFPAYIGGSCCSFRPNAKIDELRVYNRALSVDEINQLYMMGK